MSARPEPWMQDAGEIRQALIARRQALGLSQTDAGIACTPAISQQTISEIEGASRDPRMGTVLRYARQALGLRLACAAADRD